MSPKLAIILVAACGAAPPRAQPPGSRGMRASEHLAAAEQQDELARQRTTWPDTRGDATGRTDQLLVGSPWRWTWDADSDHERLAQTHRAAAADIHAEYAAACGAREHADVAISPIQRYGLGGSATSDGVTLYLSPDAGPADHLLADIRCHRAWMMLGPADMDTCPLDLAGLTVDASGDANGITVTLRVRDRALVPELQKRAAHELELSTRRHPSGTR
jgi:hypothetical protein